MTRLFVDWDAAMQHAVAVHGHQDCAQLREELAKMVKAQ